MRITLRLVAVMVSLGITMTSMASAQMIQTQAPLQQIGSGFYESSGFNWNLSGPNFFAQSGGGMLAPPFGGFDPNSASQASAAFGGGKVRGSLGFSMAQGSQQSISSTTPSITTMNGQRGSISSQTISPFVTGLFPVIGGYAYGQPTSGNVSSQMFSQHQQAQSNQLRARQQSNWQSRQTRAQQSFQRGWDADREGDLRKARANYRKALQLDQGPLRASIWARMQERGWIK